MEYILETENINKKYGQFNALNNLNMHIFIMIDYLSI